ncbi:MAG: sugar transferase [Flavobacterium sp.]|nr:sugar transferase [Flavobacterium sp.]
MYKSFFKRFLDLLISVVALVVLSPLLIFVSIALYIVNKGSIFFFQERPGMNQKPFHIIKFKSMTDERDQNGQLLPDNQRMTGIGSFVRKMSIDELPQLFNVIKGDMSLIGPRPLLFKYIPLYSTEQLRRHEVRPGITGWAQVNGRNSISWTDKFRLDVEYVDRVNLFFDIKILFLTVLKVFKQEGVNQTDSRPMEPFNGKN